MGARWEKAPIKTGRVFFMYVFWHVVSPFVFFRGRSVVSVKKPKQTFVFVRKNPEKPLVPGGTNKVSWRSWFFLCVVLGGKIGFSTLVADLTTTTDLGQEGVQFCYKVGFEFVFDFIFVAQWHRLHRFPYLMEDREISTRSDRKWSCGC